MYKYTTLFIRILVQNYSSLSALLTTWLLKAVQCQRFLPVFFNSSFEDRMDDSRLSSPQSDTQRSSVPELADDTSIQVLSHLSDSEDQLSDHNENHEARQDAGSQPEPEVSVSMLDRLRAPILSDLARKRKVQLNPPVGMKRSKKGSIFRVENNSRIMGYL